MRIGKFDLVNDEKVNRAIYGTIGREGKLTGGVGEAAEESQIIAEYDRLGGLILQGKNKVKTGSFFDFEEEVVRETPKVVFTFRDLDGEEVEIADGEEIPMSVVAAQSAQERKIAKVKAKADAIKKKKEVAEAKKGKGKKTSGLDLEEGEEIVEDEVVDEDSE